MQINGATILIAEDDDAFAQQLSESLEAEGNRTLRAHDGSEALKIMGCQPVDLGFVDLAMPGVDGMKVLEQGVKIAPDVPLVMITGYASIDRAVKATQLGAYDFIEKPVSLDRLLLVTKRALEKRRLVQRARWMAEDIQSRYSMVGTSPAMQRVYRLIDRVAGTDSAVLIRGDTGTGKELAAMALHMRSKRADGPFVRVNCAAIPDTLIESELFGHKRGAFTDAVADQRGKFMLADGGTLFLDEIGDMSPAAQAKVLRTLETGEVERLGDSQTHRGDVRIVSATNKDLRAFIDSGRFREDLFYRISGIEISLPTLGERKEDLPQLVEHFVRMFCERHNRYIRGLEAGAMEILLQHDWPGNVRELRSAMENLVILSEGDTITARDVRGRIESRERAAQEDVTYVEALQRMERDYLRDALILHDWKVAETAKSLDIDRTNLYKKLKRLGIRKGG